MKRTVVPLFAACLFAVPAVASAGDLTLRNIDVSIGIHSRPPVVYVERKPEVIYVHDDDDRDRWERRHHRRHEWRERRRGREPQVIVIDRDRSRHYDEDRIVVTRPGTVVVMNDGRRW